MKKPQIVIASAAVAIGLAAGWQLPGVILFRLELAGLLVGAAVLAATALAVHDAMAWLTSDHARALGQEARVRGALSTRALSPASTWLSSLVLFALCAFLWDFLNSPHTLEVTAIAIAAFTLIVMVVALLLLGRLPLARAVMALPAVTFLYWVGGGVAAFAARLSAQGAIESLIGASSANAPVALIIASALVGGLVLALPLAVAAVLAQGIAFVALLGQRGSAGAGLFAVALLLCLSLLLSSSGLLRLASSSVSGPLLAHVIFEYDAAPLRHCAVAGEEIRDVDRKGLFLASSQERALVLQRLPPLRQPQVLRELSAKRAKDMTIRPLYTATCFSPRASG